MCFTSYSKNGLWARISSVCPWGAWVGWGLDLLAARWGSGAGVCGSAGWPMCPRDSTAVPHEDPLMPTGPQGSPAALALGSPHPATFSLSTPRVPCALQVSVHAHRASLLLVCLSPGTLDPLAEFVENTRTWARPDQADGSL